MKKNNTMIAFLLAAISISAMGCSGGTYPEVSGKITANGEPVSKICVVFTPDAVGDNYTPGPYSMGVTDENGAFTLKTRNGEPGAVVGPHKVGFEWNDIDFDAMSGLKDELSEAVDAAGKAAVQKRIDQLKQTLASRPKLDFTQVVEFEVSKEGTKSADFEIGRIE